MRNIKHVVIMDDSPYKTNDIESTLAHMYPQMESHVFRTANEGLRYMMVTELERIREEPDAWLLVTDMQMPVIAGAGIDKKAGRHVLNEMHRHMLLHENIRVTTVVVSGDKQDEEYLKQLYDGCVGYVQYSPFVSLRSQLTNVLEPDA